MPRKAKLTLHQIESQIQALQQQAEALRSAEVAEVVEKIKSAISIYGLTAADLGLGAGAGRRKIAPAAPAKRGAKRATAKKKAGGTPKYSDRQGNTWTGHGKRPNWFKTAIEGGKRPEDLLV